MKEKIFDNACEKRIRGSIIMGQYIHISTPSDDFYKRNIAITRIVSFVGEKYKDTHFGKRVHSRTDYQVGLDYLNKKCGKGYKTTIRALEKAQRSITGYNAIYNDWRFHKRKAEKFFLILYRILKELKPDIEVWNLFEYLCNDILLYINGPLKGSDIIAYPYRSAINHAINNNNYTDEERRALKRIERSIRNFDQLY